MKLAERMSSSSAGRMDTEATFRYRPLETSRTVVIPHPMVSSVPSIFKIEECNHLRQNSSTITDLHLYPK